MITFGIITDGKRPEKLMREIASIRALNCPDYEIIVCGNTEPIDEINKITVLDVFPLPRPELAAAGRLGAMRNVICQHAKGEILSIADDDIIYARDWYNGLSEFGRPWEVMCARLLNPDGTRNWDWVTKGGPRGHFLVEYWEYDPFIYVTGGRIVLRKSVVDKVAWDYDLGFNQEEDVKFSRALQAAGIEIVMNKKMTMIHDDPTYTSKGHTVYLTGV